MKKRGRKKWEITERMNGRLPGDERHEGRRSFVFAHLHKREPSGISDEEYKAIEKRGLSALEESRNLDEDQIWALDYLTELFRSYLLTGDSESISGLATALEYRKKFLVEQRIRNEEPNLEHRLYEIAIRFQANDEEGRFPTRREAKDIALDELEAIWKRKNPKHTAAQFSNQQEYLRKSLPWTKTFKSLAKIGLYILPGKPGAPKRNDYLKGRNS